LSIQKKYAVTDNKEVVLRAVTKNGMSLSNVSKEFRNDKEVLLQAVAQEGRSLQ